MELDRSLVAEKLRRWEKYLLDYRLPDWEALPEFGLYMDQVLVLLEKYLNYLPPELKDEEFITAATINNYVRLRVMPGPVKKRYYRKHIAYLIILCTMKQTLSLSTIGKSLRVDLTEEETQKAYTTFVRCHRLCADFFVAQIKECAARLLGHPTESPYAVEEEDELILVSAMLGGFSKLLAEKLLLLKESPPPDENSPS